MKFSDYREANAHKSKKAVVKRINALDRSAAAGTYGTRGACVRVGGDFVFHIFRGDRSRIRNRSVVFGHSAAAGAGGDRSNRPLDSET
jgi:hypothetical protein